MQTILVIEDEADIADLVAFNLRRNNFNVELSPDGLHGLAAARSLLPDLIVLDLMMPGMNGVSLFKELQRESATRKIPVIMLTARGQTRDREIALEAGVSRFMTKPFSNADMLAAVRDLTAAGTAKA